MRVPSMTRLMTMSSCLSPGSNLELRRRESALVFFFFCVCGQDVVRRTANGLLRDIIITRPLAVMHRSVGQKLKKRMLVQLQGHCRRETDPR